MRRAKGVVLTLAALREAAQTAELAQRVHALAATRQNFVRVGLVAHIPHQSVIGRVEHIVQSHREFHRAQVGAEVATGARHALQYIATQLIGQGFELGARQPTKLTRVVDGL